MTLSAGARLGSYSVVSSLGAGGMGEVYRARDTRLARDVAIKVLPELFAADRDRLARFEREAQVLASLNHPNIAQIYGVEDSGGVRALVMELVEGQTLADRLVKGPLPLDEALAIARQIIEALEAAHEQGIIHRDLKPANIKVRDDGTVKVLDFGLAKTVDPPTSSAADAMISPTISIHSTEAGMILGTAAYMAPEQARGRSVDRRADIWAFGVVVFEMLAGRRPFDGGDVSGTIAEILKSDPDWQALPPDTPPGVIRLLRRCLQKDLRQRLQHIGDARLDIDDLQGATPADKAVARARASGRERLAWISAIVIAAIATAAAVVAWRSTPGPPEMRVDIDTPPTIRPTSFAISPDGLKIVYNANSPDGALLWIRDLAGNPSARPLTGTDDAQYPFWSPDNRSIGFFSRSKLKVLDIDGGQPRPLATVITPGGGSWNTDGTILFVANDNAGVVRISDNGGEITPVTPKRSPALATRMPQFLPDGRHFLFHVARGGEPAGVYVGELGSDAIHRILETDLPAFYSSGHLWFVRERTLYAEKFNTSTQTLSGQVIRVADGVGAGINAALFSTSAAGHVAYRTAAGPSTRRLAWFDRGGAEQSVGGEDGGAMSNPSVSPDRRYVVVQRTVQQNIDLWSLDLTRNAGFMKLTDNPGIDSMPLWLPDGVRILFNTDAGPGGMVLRRFDGTAKEEAIRPDSGPGVKIGCDWSADGRFLLYKQFDPATGTTDLWAMPMEGDRKPFPVVQSPGDDRDGQFSPDGKWIAYESDDSGQRAIYLQPFPRGQRQQVSTKGGTQVRWRPDGGELYYIATDGYLMAVPMGAAAGPSGIGTPARLFKTRLAPMSAISRQHYDVARDGRRFLFVTGEEAPPSPITLILNWNPRRADSRP